jgi:hypothetical protein
MRKKNIKQEGYYMEERNENKKKDENEKDENIKKDENEKKLDIKSMRTFGEKHTDSIANLITALAKAQLQMTNGSKSKQGYGYKYMELGTIIDIARKPLAENGLVIIQSHEIIRDGVNLPIVVTHTTIAHESGEWFKSSIELVMTPMKQLTSSQIAGVAMTYGRRYSLQAMLLISGEEDTDGTV